MKTVKTVCLDTQPAIVHDTDHAALRSAVFVPKRRHWPGVVAAMVMGGAIAAVLVSNYYDDRTLGQRLDATVQAANTGVKQGVSTLHGSAQQLVDSTAAVGERAAGTLGDAGITAAVKAALAADPALSVLRINVSTQNGVVRLEGPAPDAKARDRATVLASAPDGVRNVENRLTIHAGTEQHRS